MVDSTLPAAQCVNVINVFQFVQKLKAAHKDSKDPNIIEKSLEHRFGSSICRFMSGSLDAEHCTPFAGDRTKGKWGL